MIDIRKYASEPLHTTYERTVHIVTKNPGISLGRLNKIVEKPNRISRDEALDSIQQALDDGKIIAEEKIHAKNGRPFLCFYPASQEPTP